MRNSRVIAVTMWLALLPVAASVAYGQGEDGGNTGRKDPVGTPMVYKTVDGRPLHLYVSSPPASFTGPRPAIIFFHGGGWTSGSVVQFNTQSLALAARGMVAIDVEYRLIPKPPVMDSPRICVEDAKSAIRWVREHAAQLQVDPNKIVGSGGSAGGYLAGAAALVPEWDDPTDDLSVSAKPNALVLFFPAIAADPSSPEQKSTASARSITISAISTRLSISWASDPSQLISEFYPRINADILFAELGGLGHADIRAEGLAHSFLPLICGHLRKSADKLPSPHPQIPPDLSNQPFPKIFHPSLPAPFPAKTTVFPGHHPPPFPPLPPPTKIASIYF